MDDWVEPLISIAVLLIAVFWDWPRALAGAIAGVLIRWLRYSWLILPVAVVAIAALGELVYWVIGRGSAPSWHSFVGGLVVSGVCSFGLFRVLRKMMSNAG